MMKKQVLLFLMTMLSLTAFAQSEPYAVLSNVDLTVTFYYDDQKATRGGIEINNSVIYFGSSSPYGTATKAVFSASFANYKPVSTAYWFMSCGLLTAITGIENLNTSNVTNMERMFQYCSRLTSLDLSSFDTSNVTDMHEMFDGCDGLTSLNLSGFNTSNVTNMERMFQYCSRLTSLDLSSFDTSNVTDMHEMFCACDGLTSLNLSGFDTSNVTSMRRMFCGCSGLMSLDVSNFNTSNVTDMHEMFQYCSSLTSLDLSGFNTSNVTNMDYMFDWCSGLTSLDLSGFDTSNVTAMGHMFSGCYGLTSLDLSSFDTSNLTSMSKMFQYCSRLTSLDLSSFDTSNVTDMHEMFEACSGLTTIYADAEKWSTANVTDGYRIFVRCTSLVGGNGTVYDAMHSGAEYARIDKPGQPGYFTQKEHEMEPIDNAEFSTEIDESTNLDGNVVGDIYYNISSGDGSYNAAEGCIVVTTPTDDSVIDGQDIFGEDFQDSYTGIVFKVNEGKGIIKVEAQTTGNMVLKVKIGNSAPIEKVLTSKQKVEFPYNVSEPTYVYIYAGISSSGAPGMAGASAGSDELKLYGIEVTKDATGISAPLNDKGEMINNQWYTLDGQKLQGKPTRKGVYIVNGKKTVIK